MSERLLGPFDRLVMRLVEPLIRYRTLYTGRVTAQNSDDTVDVRIDSDDIPGVTHVPIRYGIAGAKVKVTNGARVLVTFANGDPKAPVVIGWEPGATTITELDLGDGTARVIREGDVIGISGAVVPGGSGSVAGTISVTAGQIPPQGGIPAKSKVKA